MGYFANGTEGMVYMNKYCCRCIHYGDWVEKEGCPVWGLHLDYNDQECNKEHSFLHSLIPLSEDGIYNEKCRMFIKESPNDQTK